MKTGTSSLMDSHLVDFTNPNANNIKSGSTTSKKVIRIDDINEEVDELIRQNQTEISDEEIKEFTSNKSIFVDDIPRAFFILGAEWYREQLKNKV
jgi:hypothetical protein